MAVLNAVRGWEYHAGLPHINDVGKENEEEEDNIEELGSDEVEGGEVVEAVEEGAWTAEELDRDLPGLLASNYESLLLEHEKHIGAPSTESLRKSDYFVIYRLSGSLALTSWILVFDLSAYIPDALSPQYESFRGNLVSWLRTLGIIKGSSGDDAAGNASLPTVSSALY